MPDANLFNTTELMSFTKQDDLTPICADALPAFARDALNNASDEQDFARLMALADAECIERYGDLIEGLEIWRLNKREPGWLALHFDGDCVDIVFHISNTLDYAAFHAGWLAPVASKIIASEKYFAWCHEQYEAEKRQPAVH